MKFKAQDKQNQLIENITVHHLVVYLMTMCMVMTNPEVQDLHHYNVKVKKLKKMKSIMKLCGKVARMLVGLAKSSEAYDSNRVFLQAA